MATAEHALYSNGPGRHQRRDLILPTAPADEGQASFTLQVGSQAEGLQELPSIGRPGEKATGSTAGLPAADVYLPQPPTRTEKYSYFRNRRPYRIRLAAHSISRDPLRLRAGRHQVLGDIASTGAASRHGAAGHR